MALSTLKPDERADPAAFTFLSAPRWHSGGRPPRKAQIIVALAIAAITAAAGYLSLGDGFPTFGILVMLLGLACWAGLDVVIRSGPAVGLWRAIDRAIPAASLLSTGLIFGGLLLILVEVG